VFDTGTPLVEAAFCQPAEGGDWTTTS